MTSRECRYYKRVLRAATTLCCSLAIGAALLPAQTPLPQAPPPAPKQRPAPIWEHELTLIGTVQFAAALDVVFVGSTGGTLQAYAVRDGALRWSLTDAPAERLAAGGAAVLAIAGGVLVSREAADGRLRWRQPMPEGPVGLSWHADRVAVTSGAHARLYDGAGQVEATLAFPAPLLGIPVIDASHVAGAVADGRIVVFARSAPERPTWSSAPLPGPVEAIALHEDRLFASTATGTLVAFVLGRDRHGARPEWAFQLYRQTSGPPAVDDRSVYVATLDNALHAIDRRTGGRRWHRPLGARPIGGVLTTGTRVVATLADGSVVVVDARTGAGVARLAGESAAERLEAAALVGGDTPALVTITSNTSGLNLLRLWRLEP